MADTYGGFTLPAPIPVPGVQVLDQAIVHVASQRITDPLLYFLGTYLATVANTEVGDAWREIEPSSTSGPCQSLYFGDPTDITWDSNADLPAFFLYREGSATLRPISTEHHDRDSTVVLDWVLADAQEDVRRDRTLLVAQVQSAIALRWREDDFIRHPAWFVPGDTARGAVGYFSNSVQVAPARGSVLRNFAHYRGIKIGTFKRDDIAVGPKPVKFDAYRLELLVTEGPAIDKTRYFLPLKGLTSSIQTHPTDPLGAAKPITFSDS